ncbi:MAG TPA: hypothetical protein VFM01_03560 [Nakamurella sp.]|nr:hypothetical protein [Nakamurella sp.]
MPPADGTAGPGDPLKRLPYRPPADGTAGTGHRLAAGLLHPLTALLVPATGSLVDFSTR